MNLSFTRPPAIGAGHRTGALVHPVGDLHRPACASVDRGGQLELPALHPRASHPELGGHATEVGTGAAGGTSVAGTPPGAPGPVSTGGSAWRLGGFGSGVLLKRLLGSSPHCVDGGGDIEQLAGDRPPRVGRERRRGGQQRLRQVLRLRVRLRAAISAAAPVTCGVADRRCRSGLPRSRRGSCRRSRRRAPRSIHAPGAGVGEPWTTLPSAIGGRTHDVRQVQRGMGRPAGDIDDRQSVVAGGDDEQRVLRGGAVRHVR